MLPLFLCARVCLFAVVGGMLCKSDKPSIIIIIIHNKRQCVDIYPDLYALVLVFRSSVIT